MLLFRLKFGKAYRAALEESERTGRPLPPKFQEAPELLEGLEIYLEAFNRLSSGRNTGFGISGISWMQIEEYCDRQRVFDEEQRYIFHHHISALDEAFLAYKAAEKGQGNGKPPNQNPNPSKPRQLRK